MEVLIIVLLIGLLSAMAAPSWLGFWHRQEVRTAANKLYLALSAAKSESRKQSLSYAVTLCSDVSTSRQSDSIKYSVHPYSRLPSHFTTIKNVSLVKSTVRRSPARYNFSKLDSVCYTAYAGLFPGDGFALGYFYISQKNSRYIYRVGYNTLIGNVAGCPVISLQKSECK